MNQFEKYLIEIKPFLNAVSITSKAGIPKNSLGKFYHYVESDGRKGSALPQAHYFRIIQALIDTIGAVKIGNWVFYAHDGGALFAVRIGENEARQFAIFDPTDIVEHFAHVEQ